MLRDLFSVRPVIRSVAKLNEATVLIIAMRRRLTQAEQDLETELQAVRKKHAKNFQVSVTGIPVTLSERIGQLQAAADRYVKKNEAKILPAGTQTRRLPGGVVQLKAEAGSIEFEEGHNRRTASAALCDVDGFQTAVTKLLEKFQLQHWVTLVPDINWTALKHALRTGRVMPDELPPYGMAWKRGETVRIQKPYDQWNRRT